MSVTRSPSVDKQPCNGDHAEKCRTEREQLEHLRDLCTGENIQFALSTNAQVAMKQFDIYAGLPKLIFFRDGFPMIYSGRRANAAFTVALLHDAFSPGALSDADSVHEWLSEVRPRLTHTLNDKSFEHDTQATSGSTTGDWFVLLYVIAMLCLSCTNTIIKFSSLVRTATTRTICCHSGRRRRYSQYPSDWTVVQTRALLFHGQFSQPCGVRLCEREQQSRHPEALSFIPATDIHSVSVIHGPIETTPQLHSY